MIADLKPYTEYKESGLPWLGQVPGHWETRPAFGVFVPNHEHNHGMKEKTVLSLSYGRIVIKPVEKLHGLVPESFETYQIVNPGDLILRTTDLQNDHTSLRVGMVRDRGIITSAYLALHVSADVNPEFGFQFLNVWDLSKAIYGYGSGLRQNLDFSHFKRMPVALPSLDEQAAIVRFLDWANGRLERAIRAKRKVIALLNEEKQAIIHRAVTRGLDPSVPLKPSGIPWLGDIPQHWQVRRLKSFVSNVADQTAVMSADEIYIALENVESWTGRVKPQSRQDEALFTGQVKRFQANDVLFGKLRPYLAKVITASSSGVCVGEFFVLRPIDSLVSSLFLEQLLRTSTTIDVINSSTFGAKMPRADWQFVGDLRVALPPVTEQNAIVESIHLATRPLAAAISRLEREIELLREYRTRLVADVVTGKLDVREAAAKLPAQPDDVAAADEGKPTDEASLAPDEEEVHSSFPEEEE
jgi:type I restriction enzyme S subunit